MSDWPADLMHFTRPSAEDELQPDEAPPDAASLDAMPPDAVPPDAVPPDAAPPEFGLLDVIEAFTAMRHDWRGQVRESRALSELVQTAAATLQEMEGKLLERIDRQTTDDARQFAELLTETDHQLTRAIDAVEQSEAYRASHEDADTEAIQQRFDQMGPLARWFARPLMDVVMKHRPEYDQSAGRAEVEGLNLVLARLRRGLKEQGVERIDVLGEPFDANLMNAIGAVEADDQEYPSGHVAEQLAPAYRWRGQLLRYADVRVIK
ncbi:MAG: nucleotide exchange factor GrpE [Pirellulales bacterium]